MEKVQVGGLSLGQRQQDQHFFTLLEYFPGRKRWFLTAFHHDKEKSQLDQALVIKEWASRYQLEFMVVDFPITAPPCQTCQLSCPGEEHCPVEAVVSIRKKVADLLELDEREQKQNPKQYELERNESELYDHFKHLKTFAAKAILTRSFKRRLRKGFRPYFHRAIEFDLWCLYYDRLLKFFQHIPDSTGALSLASALRLNYLRRHLPAELFLYESRPQIILLELLQAQIVTPRHLLALDTLKGSLEARQSIVELVEKKLNVFIYQNDVEVLIRHPRAFATFLLGLAGAQLVESRPGRKEVSLPNQCQKTPFLIPHFLAI